MRIAVIGLGFMGTTHLQAWKSVANGDIVAVCSADPKKLTGDLTSIQGNLGTSGERFDFSAMKTYSDTGKLLADPDIDAVDICLPTHLHSPVSVAALRAGKHVLVEKPMALDGAAADEMIAEAERAKRVLMAGQVLRFFPEYRAMADEIRSKNHGPVRSVLLRRRCAAPFWNEWLGDAGLSGGGVFDLLIHDVDFAVHLFGVPQWVSATGYEDLPGGIDTITATLIYPDGLSVVITGGWHHKKAYPFSMEYTAVTDGATFEFDSAGGAGATVYSADGESRPLSVPTEDAFAAELRYFTECCEAGRKPEMCPPEESATSVKLTRVLLEARRNGGERIPVAI